MMRVLTIVAAIVALVVSAAPASAGLLSSPLGVSGAMSTKTMLSNGQRVLITNGTADDQMKYAERFTVDPQDGATRSGANHTEGTVSVIPDRGMGGLKGIVTNSNDPENTGR
jgi:hypothetical protein